MKRMQFSCEIVALCNSEIPVRIWSSCQLPKLINFEFSALFHMENQNTKPYTNIMFTYFKSWQIGMKVKIENES